MVGQGLAPGLENNLNKSATGSGARIVAEIPSLEQL